MGSEVLTFLLVVLSLIALWLLLLSFFCWRAIRHYQHLTKGTAKGNLQTLLESHLKRVGKLDESLVSLEETVRLMQKKDLSHLQKVGLVRFNPFKEVGGDQSFAIALLDGQDSGLVLSSLHGREETRLYAKPVGKGEEKGYSFSKEEKDAIERTGK